MKPVEVQRPTSVAAAAIGACMIERHITLDRAMWRSDQPASVEPGGFTRLVAYIRATEVAFGDGVKRIYDSEKPIIAKLRRVGMKRTDHGRRASGLHEVMRRSAKTAMGQTSAGVFAAAHPLRKHGAGLKGRDIPMTRGGS